MSIYNADLKSEHIYPMKQKRNGPLTVVEE